MALLAIIAIRWSPFTFRILDEQLGLTEWLAKRILFPLRVANVTNIIQQINIAFLSCILLVQEKLPSTTYSAIKCTYEWIMESRVQKWKPGSCKYVLPLFKLKRKLHFDLSYTRPRRSASSWEIASPQYSEINSFFCAASLIKIPQPATNDSARRRCLSKQHKIFQSWHN